MNTIASRNDRQKPVAVEELHVAEEELSRNTRNSSPYTASSKSGSAITASPGGCILDGDVRDQGGHR